MATIPIGTTVTTFNNTFINTDPQYVRGLNLWRQYPGIPEAADVTELSGVLPIVVNQSASNTIKVSFDIQALPATNAKTQKSKAYTILNNSNLPVFAPASQTINTILPVKHVQNNAKAVLYFDITSVPRAEIGKEGNRYSDYGSRKTRISVKPYNGSNGVNVISELPMVDEVRGDTATFSFDITKLPKV